MANILTKAISDLHFKIPHEILTIAFREMDPAFNAIISMDENILARVVRPRILTDCNIVGGVEIRIPIAKCEVSYIGTEFTITVPKALTHNKAIISPLSIISIGNVSSPGFNNTTMNSGALGEGLAMYGAVTKEIPFHTSRLESIGENIIAVSEPSGLLTNGILRCTIENNTNMSNINVKSSLVFSNLVMLGVQSYIHNLLRIKLGKGYIHNGYELDTVKDAISDYADAEAMYIEELTTRWSKVAFMNDESKMTTLISNMF